MWGFLGFEHFSMEIREINRGNQHALIIYESISTSYVHFACYSTLLVHNFNIYIRISARKCVKSSKISVQEYL
jgi:hypothetical protein